MKEAMYYEQLRDGDVRCLLCPHNCIISNIKSGMCLSRGNIEGKLYSANYGIVSSLNLDPIEKKPLYHFYPGKKILSIGTFGCNLRCRFCQNWEISQTGVAENMDTVSYSPEKIADMADKMSKYDNIGLAYTYNEPFIWYEFVLDTAKIIREKGLKNVMVSNGYINSDPLDEILNYIDAFNIDLKAFSERFYREVTGSSIEEVKRTLVKIKKSGKHLEITNLVITGENDSEKEFEDMINWIVKELGRDTILHISRYFPRYKMTAEETSVNTIRKFYEIASKKLDYVYVGNILIEGMENTKCSKCKKTVIERQGYSIKNYGIKEGCCDNCGNKIVVS